MAKQSDPLAGTFESEQGFFAEENELDRSALLRIGAWGVVAVGALTLAVMSNQWSLGLRREQVANADLARQARQIQALARESQNEARRLASAIETLNGDRDRLFSRVTVLEQGLDSVTGALARQNTPATAPLPAPQPAIGPQAANTAVLATASTPQPLPQQPSAASPPPVAAPVATAAAAAPPADKPTKPDAVASAATNPAAKTNARDPSPMPLSVPIHPPPSAAASLMARSTMGPPDAAVAKLNPAVATADDRKTPEAKIAAAEETDTPLALSSAEVTAPASSKTSDEAEAAPATVVVQRTEFAVELGGANTLTGLRALWRGLRHVNADLAALSPIVIVKEGTNGLGTQLHLAAGPLKDAALAAKICAALATRKRACGTTLYDGQRLAMKEDEAKSLPPVKSASDITPKAGSDAKLKPNGHSRHANKEEQQMPPPPPPPPPPDPEPKSAFSLFGHK